MKRFFLLIVIILATQLRAQHCCDVLAEDARGPVKEIVSSMGDIETISYDKDGQEIMSNVMKKNKQHDAQGYLVAYEYEYLGMNWSAKLSYDNQHRLKKQVFDTNGGRFVMEFVYGQDGHVSKANTTIHASGIKRQYTSTYRYLTFDDYGNWIRRICQGRHSSEYQERIIRYW